MSTEKRPACNAAWISITLAVRQQLTWTKMYYIYWLLQGNHILQQNEQRTVIICCVIHISLKQLRCFKMLILKSWVRSHLYITYGNYVTVSIFVKFFSFHDYCGRCRRGQGMSSASVVIHLQLGENFRAHQTKIVDQLEHQPDSLNIQTS